MHRFHSSAAVFRFRFTAVLGLFLGGLAPLCLLVLVRGLDSGERSDVLAGAWLMGAFLPLFVLRWILARSCRCPLCRVAVLGSPGCSKNRAARRLFGSYRLRVSLATVFRGWFQCPYCNEPVALQARRRRH